MRPRAWEQSPRCAACSSVSGLMSTSIRCAGIALLRVWPARCFVMVANRLSTPASKRRTILEWLDGDVELPAPVSAPSLDQCYRAIDAVADATTMTEAHLFARLTSLMNLELRWCCHDLTSAYFETTTVDPNGRFSSKRFGCSRDHRSDRPQVMIALLVTGDGIPIAHRVFDGNTRDSTTMPEVMAEMQQRFGVGRIALVADRGLISKDNPADVAAAGFDHVIATRLRRDAGVAALLAKAAEPHTQWVSAGSERTASEINHDGRRHLVVDSPARHRRDDRAANNSLPAARPS